MKAPRELTELMPRLAGYRLSHGGRMNPPAPINLTLSITNQCNSRCKSCDIWKIYPAEKHRLPNELRVEEIEKLFRSIGPVWFLNISGGEPFLRRDIVDIVRVGCEQLRPAVVHIPTNALLPPRVLELTERILEGMRVWGPSGVKLTVKPSFDGVGGDHDEVRGVRGNWERLVRTVDGLRELRARFSNLRVGVGTVISRMNIDRLPGIIEQAEKFRVDTYISEIAEERVEMRNAGSGITPSAEEYARAIEPFREDTARRVGRASGMERLTLAMRHEYYDLTRRWLEEQRQVIPCYGGISNVHISAWGEVWPCAVLADSKSLGNVRDVDFDFWRLWHSKKADEVRAGIARGECHCPLANQAYANILLSPAAMTRVARTMASGRPSTGEEPPRAEVPAGPCA